VNESQATQHNAGRLPLQVAAIVIILWALFATLIPAFFLQPPTPVPASVVDQFSAERAAGILEELVSDGIPHPAGSEQNDVVRERIVKLLKGYGYQPEIQKTSNFKWRKPGEKEYPLENILARLPGKKSGQAIMLASHYDSVPQGPGASDDGVGTAALLEIARLLKSEGPFEHDIVLLISDGEELGLLGADKFVEEHPWANEIECVINLEARGTTGPSFMFETSDDSRWLIPVLDHSVPHPMTSSLFYEIYKQLPNDTDFTMFKRGGMQGFNFAFIGNVNNYHTPDDNFENVDMRTLQHHGENMLGLARTLGNIDFEEQPTGRVVYFDLLGTKVVWWPANWSVGMSLIGLLFILATTFGFRNPGSTYSSRFCSLGAGALTALITVGVLGFAGYLIGQAMGFDGTFDVPWPQFAWPVPLAFYLITLTICGAIAWGVRGRVSAWGVWSGTWLVWAALTVAVASKVDGASYLFIIPLLAAGGTGVICLRQNAPLWAAAIGPIVCGFLWLPMEALFFDALGFKPLGIILLAVRSTLVGITVLPVFLNCNRKQQELLLAITGGLAILATLASLLML
jgi:hypothetical protein